MTLIYNVHFTLPPLVELIQNSTNAKEQKKIGQDMLSKKSVTVSFVTSETHKMRKKVEDFLFLPLT